MQEMTRQMWLCYWSTN